MSKINQTINGIIREAGWAKAYAELDDVTKYKRITGVVWVDADILNDASREGKLLWQIPAGKNFPRVAGPEPVKPDPIPNTEEQETIAQDIAENAAAGTTPIVITEGTINNFTVPSMTTKNITVKGVFQNGATITNESTKTVTIENTGDEAVDIVLEGAASSFTLKGKFNQVYSSVRTVSASNANVQDVIFDQDLEGTGPLSVTADWTDPVHVTSYNTNSLSIRNSSDTQVLEELNIEAPNATVTLYGKWGNVTGEVGYDTLYLDYTFAANSLVLKKGNCVIYCAYPEELCPDITVESGEATPYAAEISNAAPTINVNKPGIYTTVEDVNAGALTNPGILAGGHTLLNLNHTITSTGSRNAALFMRGYMKVDVKGDGAIDSDTYGLWVSGKECVANIYGGTWNADTHALYAENGTINVYGGTFSVKGEDKRYVLNCLDASYQSGDAKINVYGGTYIDFDPANSMSEPSGPVSFVAEGYKSVRTDENIWQVFPVDVEIEPWVPAITGGGESVEIPSDDEDL